MHANVRLCSGFLFARARSPWGEITSLQGVEDLFTGPQLLDPRLYPPRLFDRSWRPPVRAPFAPSGDESRLRQKSNLGPPLKGCGMDADSFRYL